MKLNDYKLIFVAVGLIGALLIASPAIAGAIRPPGGEQFSELYLLGPDLMAENYPYNIVADQNYSVNIVVGNHMGSSAYYTIFVKFRNQTDTLPNTTTATPSPLQPLYEYKFSIPNGQSLVNPVVFSVSDTPTLGNQSIIKQITINNIKFDVNKPATWDSNSTKFRYGLFFELWLYDVQSTSIQFNSRFVGIQLNLTRTL
jgi:hypothetical protein